MSGLQPRRSITLAVHPTWAGFGWIAFEAPFAPFDWGLAYAGGDKNVACLRKLDKLLGRLGPETFVIEAFEHRDATRAGRIGKLCRAMVSLAVHYGAEVAIHSRGEVQTCFASTGARTRREIAEAVARNIDALRPKLPRPRRTWEKEDPRLALFTAAALALTTYARSTTRLLEDLKGPG